ncbi:MAG: hypothetical protein ACD_4C00459G0014 [uncultured bacterium (gcode 4)]|uniref:PPM-type phosphatase domain-containing protein n=1 Tax=uncultured bacterium (gcode 4) TaxID=1234023 RepID=K2GRW3_9BACT|nr:MAG: hypothetical protein ACD_4C00459G0014 [uncultured bacterium (gcode 4)]
MIIQKIKNILTPKKQDPEVIKWFKDAFSYIKMYEKISDYNNAIYATRELILKTKSAINYNEEVLKKLYTMESSNIESVSRTAQEKIKKIKKIIDSLYLRLSSLDVILRKFEQKNENEKIKLKKEQDDFAFKKQSKEIKLYISKKDYLKALSISKKLVFDFPNNKEALNILTKVQSLHTKEKNNKEKESKKSEKIDQILWDLWVSVENDKNNEDNSLFWKLKSFFKNSSLNRQNKKDYIKRLKTFNDIEKMLIKTGTINDINEDTLKDNDIFQILWNGLTKDLEDFKIQWFNVFWKIIWKDKIIWDTFWYYKIDNERTLFYIWDATWHWIQAWFTVTMMTKLFFDLSKKIKSFQDLFLKINNWLKERIKWKMFITSIFFEWNHIKNSLNYIWAWHIPLLVYRKKENKVERVICWWLALWVRMINNVSSIKVKELEMDDWDVVLAYTDWIIEIRDTFGKMFWVEGLEKLFLTFAEKFSNPEKIFEQIMREVEEYNWSVNYEDDLSLIIFSRDKQKDLITNKEELQKILSETNSLKNIKNVQTKNKTKEDIIEQIKKERYERELKIRLDRLERLYKIWEFIKLKQDVLLYYREWYVHDKMKFYLKKAIANEQRVVIKKQEEKLQKKYSTLVDLYKKWEYEIVIKEAIDIIFKNWKI